MGVIVEGKPLPDELEALIFDKHNVKHLKLKFDCSKDGNFTIDGVTYQVKKEALYLAKKELFSRVRNKFMSFYVEGQSEPLTFSFKEPKVNSRLLYIALNSQNLGKGLSSLFKTALSLPFNAKTVFFILVIVGVVIGIFYALSSGVIAF